LDLDFDHPGEGRGHGEAPGILLAVVTLVPLRIALVVGGTPDLQPLPVEVFVPQPQHLASLMPGIGEDPD
jgi:hypothetical protein